MSDAVITAAISGAVSLASLAMTLLIKKKVDGVHKQLNSMRDQENKTNKELGHAEGKAEGVKQEQDKNQSR